MSRPGRTTRDAGASRAAILDAARERFAAEGYDRATIRSIAQDAAIDPAMVMRYFGNKEGLFAAAADFDLRVPDLSALGRKSLGAGLVSHFLERWENDDALKALLRAAASNPAAAARMRKIFEGQLIPAMAPLFPDRKTAASRAGLVVSQMLGLAFTRYLLRLAPVVALTREAIVRWLGPTIQRYLTAD